jgi:Icc-related predicted phosphoesterase
MGDVHGPKNLECVRRSQAELAECDLILLAGDVTDGNDLDAYGQVLGVLRELSDAEIVAVFGNEEYDDAHPEYRTRYRIIFMEEESKDLQVDGLRVRIVGSTGVLDRPTWWQRNNVPDIWSRYRERLSRLSELLTRDGADVLILLTHYSPTYSTLEGERPSSWPEMGSKAMEELVLDRRPDLAVHAHAHRGRPRAVLVKKQRSLEDFSAGASEVPVLNASLPARGMPTFFEVTRRGDGVTVQEHF